MKKTRMVNVRLDEETYQRLKRLADLSGASLSTTIRRHLTPPIWTVPQQQMTITVPNTTFPSTITWNGRAA